MAASRRSIGFAQEFRKLAANPEGIPALVRRLIALENEPMAWAEVVKLKTPVLIITGDADVATPEHSELTLAFVQIQSYRCHGWPPGSLRL